MADENVWWLRAPLPMVGEARNIPPFSGLNNRERISAYSTAVVTMQLVNYNISRPPGSDRYRSRPRSIDARTIRRATPESESGIELSIGLEPDGVPRLAHHDQVRSCLEITDQRWDFLRNTAPASASFREVAWAFKEADIDEVPRPRNAFRLALAV